MEPINAASRKARNILSEELGVEGWERETWKRTRKLISERKERQPGQEY